MCIRSRTAAPRGAEFHVKSALPMSHATAYTFRRSTVPAALCLLGFVSACGRADSGPTVQELATPAAPGAAQPFVVATPDSQVLLSWIEPDGEGSHALRVASLNGSTWSEPGTVVSRGDLFVNWADFPSVLQLPGGDLIAHWLQRSGEGTYAYDIRIARSHDRGATWSAGTVPHQDGVEAEHGFVSLWPAGGDSVALTWLDGRNYADDDEDAHEMMLLTTIMAPDGGISGEVVLDGRICDCCQTGHATARSGPVIFYRGRSAEEIRDVQVVRWTGNGWSVPFAVHDDGWQISGCPVNGPQADAAGDTVAVAWFAAPDAAAPVVQLAISHDGGESFFAPVRVDQGAPIGRVDVVMTADGPVVSWLERSGDAAASVMLRRFSWTGAAVGDAIRLHTGSAARGSGFPRMTHAGDGIVLVWADTEARNLRLYRITF